MGRACVAIALLAACGRLGFDETKQIENVACASELDYLDTCAVPEPGDVLVIDGVTTFDTTTGSAGEIASELVDGVRVISVERVLVRGTFRATGIAPLAIIARDAIDIESGGAIDVGARFDEGGAGALECGAGVGEFDLGGGGGGAGGSFGASGAPGGRGDNDNGGAPAGFGEGGIAIAALALPTVLRGGCAGGSGGSGEDIGGAGGAGGGAVLLVASTIRIAGVVRAGGGGGGGGTLETLGDAGGGGGGSGGMIVANAHEALVVSGIVVANGGGGGEGSSTQIVGAAGANALDAPMPAAGGNGASGAGGNGGGGGFRDEPAGKTSPGTPAGGGGGGGGGVGHIALRASSVEIRTGSMISPIPQ